MSTTVDGRNPTEPRFCRARLKARFPRLNALFCGVSTGAELLALYNRPPVRDGHVKYYTVKVPLQVQNCSDGVRGVEANWLDHMTHHFNNGASLVDGYFHLGSVNGKLEAQGRRSSHSFGTKGGRGRQRALL